MAQIAHKMALQGVRWGFWVVNFGFMRPPNHRGPSEMQFGAKKIFVEKNAFFSHKMTQNTHEMAQQGDHWRGMESEFWVFEA